MVMISSPLGWKPVMSAVPKLSLLAQILVNIFIDYQNYVAECTFSKSADNTKQCGAADAPEGHATVEGDLNRLVKWTDRNFIKFKNGKMKLSSSHRITES